MDFIIRHFSSELPSLTPKNKPDLPFNHLPSSVPGLFKHPLHGRYHIHALGRRFCARPLGFAFVSVLYGGADNGRVAIGVLHSFVPLLDDVFLCAEGSVAEVGAEIAFASCG